MPIIITVIDHQEDNIYGFRLNRPVIFSTDPDCEQKNDEFHDELRQNGLTQLCTVRSGVQWTAVGILEGDSKQYITIIDVIKKHMEPQAKEVLSTFRQERQ